MPESRTPPGVIAADFVRRRRPAPASRHAAGAAVSERDAAAPRPLVYLSRSPDPVLAAFLAQHGWRVTTAASAAELARRPAAARAQAGIVDLGSFAPAELATLDAALRQPLTGWVALVDAARFADPQLRRLVRQYCFDYLLGDVPPATLDLLARHARGMARLGVGDADETGAAPAADGGEMVGSCEAMQQLFRTIRKVAGTDASVFIAGESGTGKELTALAIHERSARRAAPFVPINCGAIPPTLLQSELFGHERGAFTGATQRRIGRIEAAQGGTLFLDEIGDLPHESQAGLLRFLQEGRIERLGGHESIAVDVRVLSATHVDLDAAMRDGRFRADLFHRLCVLRIDEPPLRARGRDIEVLARHILQRFGGDGGGRVRGFTPCAIEAMYRYAWPGNVRELINRIRRAMVMAEHPVLCADDLDLGDYAARPAPTLAEAREAAERQALDAALRRHGADLARAATELAVSRPVLDELRHRHGLDEVVRGDAGTDRGGIDGMPAMKPAKDASSARRPADAVAAGREPPGSRR
ncbi:sigma-54-dependent Fis family transcriptional regulator [Burkholderia plantarii]|uniref:sigma-54 dependent transcriptional regulator n=1 Tax=Burkholderia plantarii TaxID=41899 RepID=UPI00272BF5D8|nr:sigma-54 dependent transcriptional regulator [Burkholderia plantarii]WLE62667.1 sigma-54-dependent Fis family transcriptional regulator [Burkholderia plantarii]